MTYRLLHTDFKWKVFFTRNWRKGVQNGRSIDPSFSGNMLIMFSLFFAISEINMINQVLYLFFLIFLVQKFRSQIRSKNSLNISKSFFSKFFYLGSSVLHEDREPWILRNTKYWIFFYILFVQNKVKLGSKTDNLYFGPLTKTVKTGEI